MMGRGHGQALGYQSLQKFASSHAAAHKRHLVSRDICKPNRSAALAEWRSLVA
jgi:hypothetical protein